MTPIFPQLPRRPGLGIGLDLAYGDSHGFLHVPDRGDVIAPRITRFLAGEGAGLGYRFFSFQPRDRALLKAEHYFPAWDGVFRDTPPMDIVGLHHTMLNLGTVDRQVDRRVLLACTNTLIERYGLAWVNEDLGIWSIDGKLLPYPLPPILTREGQQRAIEQVSAVMAGLAAPLLMEFPGFSEGTNFMLGSLHAYDFFREIAEATGVAVTLDTGHLLSYQWFLGRRGADLYGELDRLPLEHCFEIHLSGCQVIDGRFVDVHHGVLRDEQLDLLEILLERCPNLHCVAYEDPKVDPEGRLNPKAVAGFQRLRHIMTAWEAGGVVPSLCCATARGAPGGGGARPTGGRLSGPTASDARHVVPSLCCATARGAPGGGGARPTGGRLSGPTASDARHVVPSLCCATARGAPGGGGARPTGGRLSGPTASDARHVVPRSAAQPLGARLEAGEPGRPVVAFRAPPPPTRAMLCPRSAAQPLGARLEAGEPGRPVVAFRAPPPPTRAMDFDDQADLLRALLFQPAVRQRLLDAGPGAFGPEEQALLQAVDRPQLARTVDRMATALRTRQSRGIGSLTDVYAEVLAGLNAAEVSDLFHDFLASPQFSAVHEVPERTDTATVEEAFHDFLAERSIGEPRAREAALLAAVMKLLAVTPGPAFRPPAQVRTVARGYVAVQRGSKPHLFAVVDGRFVTGPLTNAVADLLATGAGDARLVSRLQAMGLLD